MYNNNMNDIGINLMKLRERSGLTQRRLAIAVDITTQTVSSWETGKRRPSLSPPQTLRLCQALNCSLEELAIAFQENQQ